MVQAVYEQYNYSGNLLPFTFYPNIVRSPNCYTTSANWHDAVEIEWYKSGTGRVLLDGEKVNVGTNDFVIVNSQQIHHTLPTLPLTYTCLIIDMRFCQQAGIDPKALQFTPLLQSELLQTYFTDLEHTYADTKDVCRVAKIKRLVLDILIELRAQHAHERAQTNNATHKRIQDAILFIRQHYAEKLTLQDVAKSVYLDRFALAREFKKFTHQTVIQYVNDYRCKIVAELLASGKTISEAATECGFNNMSFFAKTFKKYMGKLPSAYKKGK